MYPGKRTLRSGASGHAACSFRPLPERPAWPNATSSSRPPQSFPNPSRQRPLVGLGRHLPSTSCRQRSRSKAESSIPDSHAGADEGAHSQHLSGHAHILKRSCGEELVHSSLTQARRPIEQACSDTVEERVSSTDEVVAQRKCYKGSSPCPIIHTMTDTSLHLHITTFRFHDSSSHRTNVSPFSTASGSRQTTVKNPVSPRRRVLLNSLGHGGSAGIGVGEAENPGRTTETGRYQSSPTPLTDGSTKPETQCRVARTP